MARRTAEIGPWPLVFVLAACGGAAGPGGAVGPVSPRASRPPISDTCAVRLAARTPPGLAPAGAPPAFAAARSTVIVHAEVPLTGLEKALEAKVPRRVAEERDRNIGVAGRLEYTVDRGRFAVRVEGGVLVVEAPLQGRAQACAKGSCYASCAPEARVTARVPMRLHADYKLRTSEVRIDVTRGCEVRALGGLVTIDVTPMLKNALAGQSKAVQASIDRELPDFAPRAQQLWAELSKTRPLSLGMCLTLAPEEIAQGPTSGTLELLKLRFGLHAKPEVRLRCGAATTGVAAKPLPPLRDDPSLPAASDVHLGIVLPDDAAATAMESSDGMDLGRAKARVKKATGTLASGLLLDLAGEACGEISVLASGVAWGDAQTLHLTGAAPMAGEGERLTAAGLEPARLSDEIRKVPIPLPIAVSALETTLPELAKGMADDRVTISAAVESAKPETAGIRGAEIVAVALLRGAVTLRAKE